MIYFFTAISLLLSLASVIVSTVTLYKTAKYIESVPDNQSKIEAKKVNSEVDSQKKWEKTMKAFNYGKTKWQNPT